MKYIAYCTKGLEEVVQLELKHKLQNLAIDEIADKRAVFSTTSSFDELVNLKSIDDLGVLIGQRDNIKLAKDLLQLLDKEALLEVQKIIGEHRPLISNHFSLTLSVAKSPLKPGEVSGLFQSFITTNYNWQYQELDHSNFDLRIFVDGKKTYLSVRLTRDSLHHRLYKQSSKPGSLKPTVAYALMVLATNFRSNLKIVDNFCGSGTILCESYLSGNEISGGDLNQESVEITKSNLEGLGFHQQNKITPLDARNTTWPPFTFDCAISNLPWDKQIEVSSITNLYEMAINEYFRILKSNGILCAIVSKPDLFIKYIKKSKPEAKIQSIKVGLLGQKPTIVKADLSST